MTLGGPGCRLQTCRRREAQWFDSTFWAARAPRFFAPHQPSPGFQVCGDRFPGTWPQVSRYMTIYRFPGPGLKMKRRKFLLQIRLKLTTPTKNKLVLWIKPKTEICHINIMCIFTFYPQPPHSSVKRANNFCFRLNPFPLYIWSRCHMT